MSAGETHSRSERIQKILARAGYGSRRACEEFIIEGRVTVDSRPVTRLGTRADPVLQDVRLDGERVRVERAITYLLHKPKGFVCTNRDPQGRPRAVDLIPDARRLYTVGRLDADSEGLILVTNDGKLANRLMHPRYEIARVYQVKVQGALEGGVLGRLRKGVFLSEGRAVASHIRVKRRGRHVSTLEVTIYQGWNRQVRRMLAGVGLKVKELRRVQFGPIRLGRLERGVFRLMSSSELQVLQQVARRNPRPEIGRTEAGARTVSPPAGSSSGVRSRSPRRPK